MTPEQWEKYKQWSKIAQERYYLPLSDAELEEIMAHISRLNTLLYRYNSDAAEGVSERELSYYRIELLFILGIAGSSKNAPFIEPFLNGIPDYYDQRDRLLAHNTLVILCRNWGLTEQYRKQVIEFLMGVWWDFAHDWGGDCRAAAISIAGDYLKDHTDPIMLGLLLILFETAEDNRDQTIVYSAIFIAMGGTLREALAFQGPPSEKEKLPLDLDVIYRAKTRLKSEIIDKPS